MAITTQSAAYLSQLGLSTFVDPSGGPDGPHGTVAYKLVPVGGWHNGQRFPYEVLEDLKGQSFQTAKFEGIEYWLVPDESTNTPGTIAHYAQRTGVQDLQNPIGDDGAYNRSVDSFQRVDYSAHTTAPEAVSKYVKDTDPYEVARQKRNELDERVKRQIGHGTGGEEESK